MLSKHKTLDDYRVELIHDFLTFTRTFFKLRTNRDFVLSYPNGRESHYIAIANALERVISGKCKRLIINVPPRYGKTELLIHFVAWTLAIYPDSNYLYISYGLDLAMKQTKTIRDIIMMTEYRDLFDVHVKKDVASKSNFETTAGGSVYAAGAGGGILGRGAGIHSASRFGGCVVIDDIIKADEAPSEAIRKNINEWYFNTLQSRINDPNTPIIFIGQRLHEDDLAAKLISLGDWETLILPAIDEAGNALHPKMHDIKSLQKMQEIMPYEFAAQYQQNPQPAGGGIFKSDWFPLFNFEPKILESFITVDTAETALDYNDATVFSFWGLYKINEGDIETDNYALHWLNCWEIRCEPKDLMNEFTDFYRQCMTAKVKPRIAAIEKKSTGSTLLSILKERQGLQIIGIERTKKSGSKTARYLEIQPYIASRQVSLPNYAKHTPICIEHMRKITANNTHRFDDICYVRGSKIATIKGYVNIENIKIGDKVITPLGIGNVSACGSTGFHSVIKNIGLEGTQNHPIFYKDDFLPLIKVPDMIMLDKLSLKNLIKWKIKKLYYLMELNIDLRHRQDIINLAKKDIGINSFIEMFGNFIAKRKYLKIILFIIKIIIGLIMIITIWSVFHLSNIVQYILKENLLVKNVKKFLKKCGKILKNIGLLQKEKKEKKKLLINHFQLIKKQIVVFVKKYLSKKDTIPIYAHQNVNANGLIDGQEIDMQLDHFLNQNAFIVKNHLRQRICHQKNIIESHVHQNVQENMDIKEVFNLTIEPYGVYYVNNILTSNCDTVYDAIKLALIDKVLIKKYHKEDSSLIAREIMSHANYIDQLRKAAFAK